uniref:Putative secreted protein n=1 Tax=Anopheles darlingi TaxID=43151 RepID=A0A2M4DK35_ANODA
MTFRRNLRWRTIATPIRVVAASGLTSKLCRATSGRKGSPFTCAVDCCYCAQYRASSHNRIRHRPQPEMSLTGHVPTLTSTRAARPRRRKTIGQHRRLTVAASSNSRT